MSGQRMFCWSYRRADLYSFHSISNGNSREVSITEALQPCSLVWLVSGFTYKSQECTWGCDKLMNVYIWGSRSTQVWCLASTLSHESGVCRFLQPLHHFPLPPSAMVAQSHDRVAQSHDTTLHQLPFAQDLLMKSCWGRHLLLPYHQNFLPCLCWRLL